MPSSQVRALVVPGPRLGRPRSALRAIEEWTGVPREVHPASRVDADELRDLIARGESATLELKSVRHTAGLLDKHDAARSIAAFANSGGGVVAAGVEDDGTITGVADPDKLVRHLVQVCGESVRPPLGSGGQLVEMVPVGTQCVVVVHVPPFLPDRPFRAGTKVYVRDGTITREAPEDEIRRLYVSSSSVHFDEQPVGGAQASDLDATAIHDFIRTAYPAAPIAEADRYLRALHAVTTGGRPTVTGVLLFATDPQAFLIDAYVSAVRFPGNTIRGDFLDRREITGRLTDQLRRSLEFLDAHVTAPSRVEGAERRELGIPANALREAVENALGHRDYRVASQTRIFVFDDRVEIRNPGTLLNQLTLDGIRLGGVVQRRNPHVAAALARQRQRENVGSGVPEMIRLTVERGLPEPEITLADGEFKVVFWRSPASS